MSGGDPADADETDDSDRDWLERGVEEGDVSVDLDDPSDDAPDTEPGADPDGDTDTAPEPEPGPGPDADDDPRPAADSNGADTPESGVDGGAPAEAPAGTTDDAPDADASDNGADQNDAALFEQDFASALGDADPGGGGGGGGETPPVETGGEFGGGAGAGVGAGGEAGPDPGGEFPGGEFGGEGGFGGAGGSGLGGGGLGSQESFEEEEFETDIDRIDLGIDGLDEMIQGGVPERSLMVAIGSAGTGKTTFGVQFLNQELAEEGGNAVYITLEESRERIISSATEKGYDFDEYVEDGRLAIVDLDPIEMANSLATIRSELPRLVSEYDASRLVLDSVSLLEMMYDDRAKRRNEIYDFTQSLKQAGVTTMMTSEASSDSAYSSRHGIVEYLTDAVFILQYVRPSDFRKTRLAIEIQKIRDANHSRETKPYEITNEGISVYRQANIF